ncbi:MAG: alpha/beta hydrolase [Deltaproteobacteria bacterium]|nr:alpha/beta hydrolase [Deltaproteobacteria bacterium]
MGPEDLNSTTVCRLMGHKMRARAQQAENAGNLKQARDIYFQATSFYLLSDFFLYRPEEEETNYLLATPCYDKFREMSHPRIEKVEFPYQRGAIKAYYHVPTGDGPFPAIVFTQGNEGVKEAMTKWAEYATARGIAVLNGEPPGWGESGLSGTRFRNQDDMRAYASLTVDFLQSRPEIRADRIGSFGVSYGGFMSLYCAGLEPRYVAAGGIGATYLDVNKVRKEALAAQRRKSHKISGAKSDEEHSRIMNSLEVEKIISQVQCPALIIHGSKDVVLDGPRTSQQLAAAIGEKTTVKVVENGDHLCSQFLKEWLADYVFDWYADQLK